MDKKKPIHEIKVGRIKASIWANRNENGVWHSVRFSRLYKEGSTWKSVESFDTNDLPVVRTVLERAYAWMLEQSEARKQVRRLSSASRRAASPDAP